MILWLSAQLLDSIYGTDDLSAMGSGMERVLRRFMVKGIGATVSAGGSLKPAFDQTTLHFQMLPVLTNYIFVASWWTSLRAAFRPCTPQEVLRWTA